MSTPVLDISYGRPGDWVGLFGYLRNVRDAVNAILNGGLNNVGTVTLTANATTTTVTNPRVKATSHIGFMPTTATAAIAKQTMYVSTRTQGTSFVITHANTADVDKTFTYEMVG